MIINQSKQPMIDFTVIVNSNDIINTYNFIYIIFIYITDINMALFNRLRDILEVN